MADRSAFGIGETRRLELPPGEETAIRLKKGTGTIDIQFEAPGVSVHDPLHEVD